MEIKEIILTLEAQKEWLEEQGYDVMLIGLYGSQNYRLDVYSNDYTSDIDTKAIIIPKLDDLLNNTKPISKVYETEHGQCEVKDIRSFFNSYVKCNPAYLEIIYSDNYLLNDRYIDSFKMILEHTDKLFDALKPLFVKAVIGMMKEKENAMYKISPSTQENIIKYGYDPKNAHHVLRLGMLLEDVLCKNTHLSEALLLPEQRLDLVMDLKVGKFNIEKATKLVSAWLTSTITIADEYLCNVGEIDYTEKYKILEISNEIIKSKIKKDIMKEGFELCLKNLEN